jgi:hypothetical protein
MKTAHTNKLVPSTPHFAAIVFSTIYIPGDERSRTNPGHGYPASSEPVVNYIVFESREEMEEWVTNQEGYYSKKDYRIIEATPLSVKFTATVG